MSQRFQTYAMLDRDVIALRDRQQQFAIPRDGDGGNRSPKVSGGDSSERRQSFSDQRDRTRAVAAGPRSPAPQCNAPGGALVRGLETVLSRMEIEDAD